MTTTPTLTWQLTQDHHRKLAIARADDKIPATDRLRAIVQLWAADDIYRSRIDEHSEQLCNVPRDPAEPDVKVGVRFPSPELPRALAVARNADGITTIDRIRAALDLWLTDPQFRSAVDSAAALLRAGRRAPVTRAAVTSAR